MANYPSAVSSFTTKVNGNTVEAAHVDDLQAEVTAIENALLNGLAHNVTITGTVGITGATTITGNMRATGITVGIATAAGITARIKGGGGTAATDSLQLLDSSDNTRFLFDDAGNLLMVGSLTIGTSLTDSVAVPTIASGFGTNPSITGKVCAFRVTIGTGGVSQGGVVAFNTTFANAPACVGSCSRAGFAITCVSTTTQVTLASGTFTAGDTVDVLVRGF